MRGHLKPQMLLVRVHALMKNKPPEGEQQATGEEDPERQGTQETMLTSLPASCQL